MRNPIFLFEIKNWVKSPIFYLLTISFFLFACVSMLGTGGFFDAPSKVTDGIRLLNSPYSLSLNSFVFTKILLFAVAIFGGYSMYRDYSNKTHSIIYSYPISKNHYLNGKIGSALAAILFVSLFTFSGIVLAEVLLSTDNPKIGSHSIMGHMVSIGLYTIPTIMIISTFVFVAVGLSRNIYSGFLVVICFVLFQIMIQNVFFNHKNLLALLDPFGQSAFMMVTQEWSFETKNASSLPVNKMVILNRIFWSLLAIASFFSFSNLFDFQYDKIWQVKSRRPKKEIYKFPKDNIVALNTDVKYELSNRDRIGTAIKLTGFNFKRIIKSPLFLVLSLFGILTVFFIQLKVTNTGEFNLLPLTRIFIGAPLTFYTLIIVLSTFLISGSEIHKARKYKMNLMVDTTPVKNWQLIFANVGALSLMHVVQLFLFLLISVVIQMINGHFYFNLSLYAFHLILVLFPILFIWNLTSQFIHTLVPNIFLGLFVLLCIWMGGQSIDQLGIETTLLKFNNYPSIKYSDLSGYGNQLSGHFYLVIYWLCLGFILLVATIIFWNRGSLSSFKERVKLSKSRITRFITISLILLTVNFIWIGLQIYRAERKDKIALHGNTSMNKILTDYKKDWEVFKKLPQAKVKNVELEINIFPERNEFNAIGNYQIFNDSNQDIDTLLIRTGFDEITELQWNEKAKLIKESPKMKSYLYKLNNTLAPGDTLELDFIVKNTSNTSFTRNSSIVANGNFLKHDILPRIGYQFTEHEISNTDSLVNKINYYHRDADYVKIQTKISTASDQIAIGPGELISQQTKKGRNVYEYYTENPVKFNFSFHSGKYQLKKQNYSGVDIQLYHLKGHHQNTQEMINGIKASLDYNSEIFGEYPYSQIRIIEFPHTEESYAATLATNNIPTSEILFNINSKNMPDKMNLPYYTMIHELAHEWFGNQLIPADAAGAKMLTESIAEYLTLQIYKKHLGEKLGSNFLDLQYKRYQKGANKENGQEQALCNVLSHQEYIAYGKGAIAFNSIAQSIGVDKFNSILKQFFIVHRERSDYYPTSIDFVKMLKAKTDKKDHEMIDRWLTKIKPVR